MPVKDSKETLFTKDWHNSIDEEEETLSLCDLPLYEKEDDLSQESQESSSIASTDDNDYFEFSQELNPNPFPTIISHPDNIIFCGKLIPYKQPDDHIPRKNTFERKQQKKNKGWSSFEWNLSSKTRANSKRDSLHQSPNKKTNDNNKSGKGYEFPVHKISVLTSSSSWKARWYFLLFGLSRVSTKVDLKDMKNRQSRRSYQSPTSSSLNRVENNGDEKINGGTRTIEGWRLWGLIRALSCGGTHHPNTMVLEPVTCTQQE